jgi:raffinose/stachyose/melibiose transport system substrate-binding protein
MTAHERGAARSKRVLVGFASLATIALGAAAVSAAAVAAGSATSAKSVTITLSMQNANVKADDPATYQIVQSFMRKNPGVKVVIQGQPVAEHEQNMTIAAQSHTLPDIFWVYNSLAQTMVKNGNLLDLAPILSSLQLVKSFPTSMLSGYRSGKTQYGVPYQSLVTGLYYNKAILAKYHLALPKTFDQLLQVVKTLHTNGVVTIAQGGKGTTFSVWAFLTMLDRFGYEKMYPAILSGKASYDNPQFAKLYTHIQELQQAGAFPANISTQTYFQAVEEFTSGQAAMLDSGVWAAGQIQKSQVGNDVGFWAGPTFADGVGNQKLFMNAPSAPLVVSAKVKSDPAKYAAVKAFIRFYYGNAGQQILVNNAQTPVTKYRPTGPATKAPVFASVLKTLATPGWTSPQAQPDLVVSAATSNAMYDSLYGVMEGVLSPSQALQTVQQTIKP